MIESITDEEADDLFGKDPSVTLLFAIDRVGIKKTYRREKARGIYVILWISYIHLWTNRHKWPFKETVYETDIVKLLDIIADKVPTKVCIEIEKHFFERI